MRFKTLPPFSGLDLTRIIASFPGAGKGCPSTPCTPNGASLAPPGEAAAGAARRQELLLCLSLLAAAALLLAPSLFYPFGRDQGVFAYAGSVILDGGWPYRDVWDLKPPGIYYTYAAMLALTGSSMGGVRALDLMAATITALLLYAAICRLMSVQAAWLGALLYAALYLRLGFWGMAQAESYANLWTAAALAAWLRGGSVPTPTRSFQTRPPVSSSPCLSSVLSGTAAAMVLLLKVTVLLPLVAALGTVSLLRLKQEGWRAERHRAQAFAAGFLAPVVVTVTVLAVSGAGAAFLEIQRDFVAGYVRLSTTDTGAAEQGWRYFWRLYWAPAVVAAAGLVGWGVQVLRYSSIQVDRTRIPDFSNTRIPVAVFLLLGVWLVAALASVALQGKYFGYHWTPVLLPLAGLAGHGLAWLLAPVGRWGKRSAGTVLLVGALLIAGWSGERAATGYGATLQLATGRLRLLEYWKQFGRPHGGDFSFAADQWAARYIQRQTRPDEPVFLWGFEPLTLFLAGRRAPTRFAFAVPLVSPWTPARWRVELMGDLKQRPPVLFGVMRRDAVPHASGRRDDSAAQLERFPALRGFLEQHYRYERTIEDLTLYRWNRAIGDGRR